MDVEHVRCGGINVLDFDQLRFEQGFNMNEHYPHQIHGPGVVAFTQTNFLLSNICWNVNTKGEIFHDSCQGVIGRDKNDRNAVKSTTLNGRPVCPPCQNLQYNVDFGHLMKRVADGEWGRTPNQIIPVFELKRRYTVLRNERKDHRLLISWQMKEKFRVF